MLQIHQTLHGYLDGHQLIAASTTISRDQDSLLLVMSDLSGPAFSRGYESYITGYPIIGAGVYCFARTWFAPERPRPGCVWTHTLLIADEDLARIPDLRGLLEFFRRPQSDDNFLTYESSIWFDPIKALWNPISLRGASDVLRALYESDKQVVIRSENSEIYENLVLSIFSQQWPKLRRSFRFCTGALSLRESEFDLSVSPPDVAHSIGPHYFVVDPRAHVARPTEEWVALALEEIQQTSSGGALRRFLWYFGPDFTHGRTAFRPLTEIHISMQAVEGRFNGEGVLSAISYYFHQPTDAIRLKSELFGREGAYTDLVGSEADILRLLISHPGAESIPHDIANISARAEALAALDPGRATNLAVIALQIHALNAGVFLEGYVKGVLISSDQMADIPVPLLIMIIDRNPKLAASLQLWQRSDSMEILSALISKRSEIELDINGLVHSLVDARAWKTLRLAFDHYHSDAVKAVFNYIDAQDNPLIDLPRELFDVAGFTSALADIPIEPEHLGLRSLALLTTLWDPRSSVVRRTSLGVWLRVVRGRIGFSQASQARQSAVFMLALGLGSRESLGAVFVASGFSTVYHAAARGELDVNSWDQLEPSLPWYSPSWDKCARLIRAAARAFVERSWASDEFCQTFATGEQFARALDEVWKMWDGSHFIKRLKQAAVDHSIVITSDQVAVLQARRY